MKFIEDNIQNQAMLDNNEPLVDINDEGEPPLSPSMITTNYDWEYCLPNDHNIDMISPSDNNIEELQSNALVSSVTVSSSSTSSGANIGKRKMKTSCMRTRGGSGGNAIGQGAYIRQRKLKFRGNLIQSKKFYCQEHSTAASIPSIISPHSAQDGPSNYSSYDSTFILTQYYSSRKRE